jgi:hypothetical protein
VSLRKNVELVAYSWSSLGQGGAGAPMRRVLWKAATGYGFGLAWPLLCALTGAMLLASSRRPRARTWAAWWAAGVGGALVLCFALRHQDAVLRFLLPAAALVTPTFAWTFDRMGRSVVTRSAVAALGLVGVGLMAWRWVGHERAMRHRDGRPLAPHERFGPDLQPLAAAVAALPEPAGARLGLLTPDYFPEGVFFGRRYRNHLVPLSYALPQGLGAIEALQLDALWVDTLEHCTMVLFRRDFARPAARPQRNRRAHPEGYDEDFSQAYGESVERVDLKPTLRALADPASTWSVWQTTPQGVLLVKAPGRRVDPRELCGAP